ncbi:hypothetical protein Droror1_Dr00020285, partial [Drosera rotundifolia]
GAQLTLPCPSRWLVEVLIGLTSGLIQPLKPLVAAASPSPADRWKSVSGNSEPLDDSVVFPYRNTWEQCGPAYRRCS